MGLDYSYEIFMPPRNVVRALVRLADIAPQGRDTPPLAVTLPGGERVIVPFTSTFKSELVDGSASGTLELDTSIVIGVDDAVRQFFWAETARVTRAIGPPPAGEGCFRLQNADPEDAAEHLTSTVLALLQCLVTPRALDYPEHGMSKACDHHGADGVGSVCDTGILATRFAARGNLRRTSAHRPGKLLPEAWSAPLRFSPARYQG